MKIILIGFMGSGKSTIGKRISEILKMEFVDMDIDIEKDQKQSINNIFKNHGEMYFRNLETEKLKKLITKENVVISTGGGIIKNKENIEILKNQKYVVFLDASCKTIIKHISDEIEKRPLLKKSDNLEKTINNLLFDRIDKYKSASNIKINVDDKNIDEVSSETLVYIR